MEELISRQATIDAFMNATADGDKFEWCKWVINQLPSAQPELSDEEKRLYKKLRSYHNGSYAKLLDKMMASAQPELPENWWKTDHGYMWLCPHCGLPVHSDFEECLRCGMKRQSEHTESINQIRWERDTAIQQLAELGYGLGEKRKKV